MKIEWIFKTETGRVFVRAKTEEEAVEIIRGNKGFKTAILVGKQVAS